MKKTSVLCVTLNPCLDKTLTVPAWKPGDNVRGTAIREVVGGKGNNVARALKGLGQSARPATFLGGSTGSRCELLLKRDDGMEPLVIASSAETRTILTVRTDESADQSAFFDPDPAISDNEADLMLEAIRLEIQSGHVQALTLSGSSPSVTTHRLYGDLIRLARESGISVLVDTYGMALKSLDSAGPDLIQLNRKEVAGILGLQSDELSEPLIFDWLKGWVEKGTRLAVLTQGPEDVLAVSIEGFWRVVPPKIQAVNPIGSGDCFLAGLTYASMRSESTPSQLKFAVACAVANACVWDAGAISLELVEPWISQIQVHQLGEF
jgi:1-phosphofructokinase family hexose kinase